MSVKRAITALQKYYPIRYAENSWDNTGLLIDSLNTTSSKISILLTIDLTKSVVQEALDKKISLIIAYHPFIFKGIKKIEPYSNPQHDSLVKLIQNGISVYSPHTAIDAANGGVNDWLIDGVTQGLIKEKSIIIPNDEDPTTIGMGRFVKLSQELTLSQLINNTKSLLNLKYIQLSSLGSKPEDKKISTIAVCAGSGSGVFSKLKTSADLYITGELSHHELLALKESGSNVLIVNHSNSERGYLQIVKENLEKELQEFDIIISETDIDPLQVV
ncbi:NGG1-interacting factor 3 [Wickerhamomyces ciferrii]|uniref:NGG1-interacting factor 3 n=1 Tax=Wickerhamomyces ciferrii (strain ATCC 14091 / BCRC 22168 / CBS 111 / JCM 3599 / NBRC 0793 / NRRL Y-1031 F-60-10) TaxID=1206466 RepID=K0KL02_WICCF|nr:NGG1-interacting factor 3 [Wickerhamomyces ciferrii]CCH42124.1 NGG1-interacting factor 3 [Wickerhamomyces ciferrii]